MLRIVPGPESSLAVSYSPALSTLPSSSSSSELFSPGHQASKTDNDKHREYVWRTAGRVGRGMDFRFYMESWKALGIFSLVNRSGWSERGGGGTFLKQLTATV